MAVPPSYVPRDVPRSMPLPNPANPGRFIAAGLQQAGNVAVAVAQGEQETRNRVAEIQYQRQAQDEITAASAGVAQDQLDYERWKTEQIQSGGLTAKAASDWWDARREKRFEGVSTASAQTFLARQWASVSGSEKAGAEVSERMMRAQLSGQNGDAAIGTWANVASVAAEKADSLGVLDRLHAQSDAMAEGVLADPVARQKLAQDGRIRIDTGYLSGWMRRDPYAAREALDSERFGYLPNRERLVDEANTLIHVREVQVEKARIEADREQRKVEDTLLKQVGDGVVVPADQLQQAAAAASARGDTPKAYELKTALVRNNVIRVYGNADPAQITARIGQIEADPEWRTKPDMVAAHDELARVQDRQRAAEPNYAPLDFANPQAIAQRVASASDWARSHSGKMVLLSKDQAAELRSVAATGPNGKAQVAEQLSRFSGPEALTAAAQVDPGDKTLASAIRLPASLRTQVFEGEALLSKKVVQLPHQKLSERWGEMGQQALASAPAELQGMALDVASNLYAFRAARKGLGKDEFDQALWDGVVNEAVSISGWGGVGRYRGRGLLLPRGMSQPEFEERVRWLPPQPKAYTSDRTPISKADLLYSYIPEATARDGVYNWYRVVDGAKRYAIAPGGGKAEMDIRLLTRPKAQPAPVQQGPVYIAPPPRDLGVQTPVYIGVAPQPQPEPRR